MGRGLAVMVAALLWALPASADSTEPTVRIETAPAPPPPPPPRPVQMQAQNPGLIVGGGVALVFGGLSTLTGVVLLPVGLGLNASRNCTTTNGQQVCDHNAGKGIAIAGGVTLGAGLLLIAGSIVMIVIGAQQVPKPVAAALQTGAVQWSF